jgi:hypothetical protein
MRQPLKPAHIPNLPALCPPNPPTHLPPVHSSIAGNTLEHELAGTAALPDVVGRALRATSRWDTPSEAVLQLHVQEGRDDR